MLTRGILMTAEDAVMEPTVLENLRVCLRAKKLQPAEVVGALSENYHGYAQVPRARRRARCIRSLEPSQLTRTLMRLCVLVPTRCWHAAAPLTCAESSEASNNSECPEGFRVDVTRIRVSVTSCSVHVTRSRVSFTGSSYRISVTRTFVNVS